MKNLKNLSINVIVSFALGLAGCSGSSGTTQATGTTSVTVQRGPVFEAVVTDASNPVQVAVQNAGQNVYVFANTPTYPITATGGWIDVDGDGVKTTADLTLTLPLTSYTREVTAVSTYISDPDPAVRATRLTNLATKVGVSEAELKKLPSLASGPAIAAQNAIYKQMKQNDNNISAVDLNAFKVDFDALKLLADDNANKTSEELAILIEQEVVNNLKILRKVTQVSDENNNTAPTANAGDDQSVVVGTTVSLDARNSTDDGTISTYSWVDDISGSIGSSASSFSTSTLAIGTHTITLTVTDDKNATGTDSVVVTVNPVPNAAPTANAGADLNVIFNSKFALDASASSDSDGGIINYSWTENGTLINSDKYSSFSPPTLAIGVHTITLTVTDDKNATATDTVIITVNPAPNIAPIANAGTDTNVILGASVTLNASGSSDKDGTIAAYSWSENGSPILGGTSSSFLLYLRLGVHTITLTVTDDKNATGTDTVVITVNPVPNVAPTANAGADQNVTLGASVTLDGSSSNDSDGTIVGYSWSDNGSVIGGGAAASFSTTTLALGTHTITLTVTDDKNATGTDTVVVTIYQTQSGNLVDPYIVGSVLCQDTDGNNICDAGEPTSTITTADGNFTFNAPLTAGKNIIIKTQGLHSGILYDLNISGVVAADGSISVVSPITTFQSRGLTDVQITNILSTAKIDAVNNGAAYLGSFSIPTSATILNDPLNGGLVDKKFSTLTDAELVNLQASLSTYGLLKILNGSTTLAALSGSALENSPEVKLIASTMLKAVSDNINTTLLGTIKGSIDGARAQLVGLSLPQASADAAIPEPTVGVIIDIAVKVIDDLAEVGFTTCNATVGSDAVKTAAALVAVGTRLGVISGQNGANIQKLIDSIYGLTYKTQLKTLPDTQQQPFLSGLGQASPDIKVGIDSNSSVTTFVFDASGAVVPHVGQSLIP